MSKQKTEDKFYKTPKLSKFELITRIISLVVALGLLVVDKGYGLMAQEISEVYYAALAGYGIIGNDIVRKFIK